MQKNVQDAMGMLKSLKIGFLTLVGIVYAVILGCIVLKLFLTNIFPVGKSKRTIR